MARILVVDDEPEMVNGVAKILVALQHQPFPLTSGRQALEMLDTRDFDLILCDLFMPEIDGMQLLQKARELAPNTPVIIFTAYGTIERAVEAIKAGAFDFLEKPFEVEQLKLVVAKGLRQREFYLERESILKQLENRYGFENIVGKSPAMLKIFELIETVAQTDANVVIVGESGTGKELVARSIHARSRRRNRPFIPVNCGALPDNLFESELFGYEKGAFTGAVRSKPGLIEMANGGTFFLDEVCELAEGVQVKLLRVLQDQQLIRLGGRGYREIDVRFISATNRDMEEAVRQHRLREDLYYRLNVIQIELPPLRERTEDIPLLAEYFLKESLQSSAKNISGFSPEVMDRFLAYSWPGNVRELQNVIERAVALCKSDQITPADLPPKLLEKTPAPAPQNLPLVEAKKRAIEEIEQKYLLLLLEKYRGNVTKMAAEAGMTRRNLHRLLKQYGFDAAVWRR